MPSLPECLSPQAIWLLGLVMNISPKCAHHWAYPSYCQVKRAAAGLFKDELSCPQTPRSTVHLLLVVGGARCLLPTTELTEILLRQKILLSSDVQLPYQQSQEWWTSGDSKEQCGPASKCRDLWRSSLKGVLACLTHSGSSGSLKSFYSYSCYV